MAMECVGRAKNDYYSNFFFVLIQQKTQFFNCKYGNGGAIRYVYYVICTHARMQHTTA